MAREREIGRSNDGAVSQFAPSGRASAKALKRIKERESYNCRHFTRLNEMGYTRVFYVLVE